MSMKKSLLVLLISNVFIFGTIFSDNQESQKLLTRALANHGVLLFQTLNYHWNIEGKEFHDYHLLFNKQYNALFENLDLIAERIRAVGGKAPSSMKEFLKHATLKEDHRVKINPKQMIINLHDQYVKVINDIKQSIKDLEKSDDFGTRKMLEDLVEMHEKTKWMLDSLRK